MQTSESQTSASSSTWTIIRVFWQHLDRYRWTAWLLFLTIVAAQLTFTAAPLAYKAFIDRATVEAAHLSAQSLWPLLWLLGVIFGLRVTGWILWRCSGFLASSVQPRVFTDLERMAFQHVLRNSYGFFSNTFVGSLVRKITGFSSAFRTVLEAVLWVFIPLAVSIVGTITALSFRRPLFGLIVAAWFVIFVSLNLFLVRRKLKYDIARAAKYSECTGVLSDALTNHTNVLLYRGFQHEAQAFRKVTDERQWLLIKGWRIGEWNFALENVLNVAVEAAIMIFGVLYWIKGTLTVGDLVMLQAFIAQLFMELYGFSRTMRGLYEAFADAKEMVDILEAPYEIQDKKKAKPLNVTKGAIEFQNVTFNYHKTRKVLDGFSLAIKPREKVALVGPSGAGKSTVVKLLFRFYDVDHGKIIVDGQLISNVTQDSLRDAIALVPQEPILFHRSLKENIRYGRRDATDDDVIAAAKKAHAHEFISNFPDGYDTLVGERGVKLSGGERQRVAIARAILKNAPILVLDEATSSLDSESESLIQEALHLLMKEKTVIVIAHRLSTIMQMDRIVVMEEGNVVDMGTHDELLKKVGTYQKLWNIQAGGFIS